MTYERMINERMTRARRVAAFAGCAAILLMLSGCGETDKRAHPDMSYLTTSLHTVGLPDSAKDNLLPLVKGDTWNMRSVCDGKASNDTLTVVGETVLDGGRKSTEIDINREGSPWRKEFYVSTPAGVFLDAMKDETSPLMTMDSSVPLIRFPLHEGDEYSWRGTILLSGKRVPATAYSRLSQFQVLTLHGGRFKSCRIDTIISLVLQGRDVRFPSVRWFAPQVGFVQRSFADKGRAAASELMSFNVK